MGHIRHVNFLVKILTDLLFGRRLLDGCGVFFSRQEPEKGIIGLWNCDF